MQRFGFIRSGWISVAISLCIAGALYVAFNLWGATTTAQTDGLHRFDHLLRLHVIAHSDAPKDQEDKLQVRNAVLAEMASWDEPFEGTDLAGIVIAKEDALIKAAEEALIKAGNPRPVHIKVGPFTFPRTQSGSTIFPAGEYQAVRVIIGEGAGSNWWCVLFPPLCFVEGDAEEAALGQRLQTAQAAERREQEALAVLDAPDASDEGTASPLVELSSVEWRLRLWESLSNHAYAHQLRDLIEVSWRMARDLSM